jgi:cell shape-determining protein MreC
MSFLQRNNYLIRENSKKSFIPTALGIAFIIFVFTFSWSRNLLFSVGSPLWDFKNIVSNFYSDNIGLLSSKVSLLKENSLLKQQVETSNQDKVLYDLIKKENEDLKSTLGRISPSQKLLLSAVLVKPFLSAYDTLIIDVGLEDNVVVGDKVLANGNTYIGYVSEVYNSTSKVVLYSSPGEKTKVLIGSNNIEKEAEGLGNSNFRVQVPREIDVKEGDSIVFPSITTNIFGIVEKVEFKESDSFQNILFKNPVNIAELKWVQVLLSNKK